MRGSTHNRQNNGIKLTIGIPRALFYYRYGTLWKAFFDKLGIKIIISGKTSLAIMEEGNRIAVDETCLSEKIYFGHVSELIGRCDYIFVPRVASFGKLKYTCPRFQALYDLCVTLFSECGQKFLTCDTDAVNGKSEKKAFLSLGMELGFSKKEAISAYEHAKTIYEHELKEQSEKILELYSEKKTRILICAHSYVYEDAYIGRPVTDFLERNNIAVIRADYTNREKALSLSHIISPNCRWEPNRELLGTIAMHADDVDGIILMTAFPCCPDSVVNEIVKLKFPDKPVLNLILDGQSGVAGLETRLESFIDIIGFKEACSEKA